MSSSVSAFGAASDVMVFWFENAPDMDKWFIKSRDYDEQIRAQFSDVLHEAERGECIHWLMSAKSYVAHIVLLDQFSRQVYRGTGKAFQNDLSALTFAKMGLTSYYPTLSPFEKMFVLMPFMHSENVEAQHECVARVKKEVSDNSNNPLWANVLGHAESHRDVVLRFGRFPKRNAALGRESTVEEIGYIASTPNIPY